MKSLFLCVLLFVFNFRATAQRLHFPTYVVQSLKGPGSYLLVDGTAGTGDLQFTTRGESILYVIGERRLLIRAERLRSFSVAGHTFWPHGNFSFTYGLHSYEAHHAFIEYADTTGGVQLAAYYTVEPTGNLTTTFTTFLLRPRGSRRFIVGPNNDKKWRQADRERLAPCFAAWPDVARDILNGTVTFENLPACVQLTRQPSQPLPEQR